MVEIYYLPAKPDNCGLNVVNDDDSIAPIRPLALVIDVVLEDDDNDNVVNDCKLVVVDEPTIEGCFDKIMSLLLLLLLLSFVDDDNDDDTICVSAH
jgi:hypothetical protein